LSLTGQDSWHRILCPKGAPNNRLKILYRSRWSAELDLRNLKTTLGMEQLRRKSPQMAIKKLWAYLLAYNLIRLLMAQSALLADQIPQPAELQAYRSDLDRLATACW